jgi:hypothetical protein
MAAGAEGRKALRHARTDTQAADAFTHPDSGHCIHVGMSR